MSNRDRFLRQSTIIDINKLASTSITVVGVGAIGRQVTTQLVNIGASHLTIIDNDMVSMENLGPQSWLESDIGLPKVEAVKKFCIQQRKDILLSTVQGKLGEDDIILSSDVIFMCVDSMASRRTIWSAIPNETKFIVDGRMGAEVCRILAVSRGDIYYPTTLFSDRDGMSAPCTARATAYCANIAAGYIVACLSKWLRGLPIVKDKLVNLITDDLIILRER